MTEDRLAHYFNAYGSLHEWRRVGVVFAICFCGKLLILEGVKLVFGGEVEIGQLVQVVALILTMMIARRLMDWTFRQLGQKPSRGRSNATP